MTTRIYLIGGGWGKPDLVYSTYSKAQEQVLKRLRSSDYPCLSIHGYITSKFIDSNGQEFKHEYKASIIDVANLRIIHVEFDRSDPEKFTVDDVLTRYTVWDDRDLVYKQMEDYRDSNPKHIYFNEPCNIENFSFSSKIGEPELVKDPIISRYFKYTAYCCAESRQSKHA